MQYIAQLLGSDLSSIVPPTSVFTFTFLSVIAPLPIRASFDVALHILIAILIFRIIIPVIVLAIRVFVRFVFCFGIRGR